MRGPANFATTDTASAPTTEAVVFLAGAAPIATDSTPVVDHGIPTALVSGVPSERTGDDLYEVRSERLFTQVVRQLLDLIGRGRIKPGQKLLPERDLARLLGVSRASIRQALTALEVMGVIEIRHGSGIFVRPPSDPWIADLVTATPGPLEILEARLQIEPGVARLAALRRTDEDISAISGEIEEMRTQLAVGLDGWQPDWGFHEAVAFASHNPSITLLARALRDQMGHPLWALMRARNLRRGDHARRYLEHHAEIRGAILASAGGTAERLMRNHIRAVMRDLGERAGATVARPATTVRSREEVSPAK